MKTILAFVKTMIVGGILFLVPLVLVIVIIREAALLAGRVLAPIERLFPAETVLGIAAKHIVAAGVLLALCLAAGLVARTRLGNLVGEQLERLILKRMPGFTLLKGLAGEADGAGPGQGVAVALARLDEAWMLCFTVEQHASGLLTVFVPSAPTPTAGSIYYLSEDQVRRLDVPVAAAVKCIMQLGIGSRDLLGGQYELMRDSISEKRQMSSRLGSAD